MKKDIIFVTSAMVLGFVVSIMVMLILGAIAAPSYFNYILTPQEAADIEFIYQKATMMSDYTQWAFLLMLPFLLVTFALFLRVLNPNINAPVFRQTPGRYKASLVALSLAAGYFGLSMLAGNDGFSTMLALGILTIGNGLLWGMAGEMGWAGDFSTWKPGHHGGISSMGTCFALGALEGAVFAGLTNFVSWSFDKYFILVSEVLDGSGEVSVAGYVYLFYGLAFMLVMSFGVAAGFATALAPAYKTTHERKRALMVPVVLLLLMLSVVSYMYRDASVKYDLDKQKLAHAVGIPERASKSLVILNFPQNPEGDGFGIQNWPLEVTSYGIASQSSMELSIDNLLRLKEYIDSHSHGSVFKYELMQALYSGYFALWDVQQGDRMMVMSAPHMLLSRMLLVSRLAFLPITDENLAVLNYLADDDAWVIKGNAAMKLARCYVHFGLYEQAKKWIKRARETGATDPEVIIPPVPALVSGRISGKISINDKHPAGSRVALMRFVGSRNRVEQFMLIRNLLSVVDISPGGQFAFESLGAGDYSIVLITQDDVLPHSLGVDSITATNLPRSIRLDDTVRTLNLGEVVFNY